MIRALDTNVLVRFLADPSSPQHVLAKPVFAESFALSTSVMMESEWVLRSVYRWQRAQIADAFEIVFDLPGMSFAPPEWHWIIDRYRNGADFADMVHICAARGATAFATFDARLAGQAGDASPIQIETLA